MTPLRPRYNRIRRCAADLLAQNGIVRPAVPVERLAKAAGAAMEYRDFNNEISGLLIRKHRMIVIAVAKEQPEQRQRFTIAHELGHLLLHDGIEVRVDKHVLRGTPAGALLALADTMHLVVVGHHRQNALARAIEGSVALSVLEHAHTAVAGCCAWKIWTLPANPLVQPSKSWKH